MYAINSIKQDPVTLIYAVKTGMDDPEKSWQVVVISDGSCHYAADEDVAAWSDKVLTDAPGS